MDRKNIFLRGSGAFLFHHLAAAESGRCPKWMIGIVFAREPNGWSLSYPNFELQLDVGLFLC